jgi:Acetyltransferase (isoleucine patch superfamily)
MFGFVWRLLDPLLLKLRSRLEHLSEIAPSRRHELSIRREALFADTVRIDGSCTVGNAGVPSNITVGDFSWVRGDLETLTAKARISVGHHCYIGPGTRIWSAEAITIGNFVQIAQCVDIYDNNSHSLDHMKRREEIVRRFERKEDVGLLDVAISAVLIEDDVWIGAKSTVLKGVRIGKGSIVGANSVVVHDVPPFTLVAGNPACEVRQLAQSDSSGEPREENVVKG